MPRRNSPISFAWSITCAIWGIFSLGRNTRSGKSTLGNFMRAMWMQYRHAQAKVFDVDGHARLLTICWAATGMTWAVRACACNPSTVDDPLRQDFSCNGSSICLEMQERRSMPIRRCTCGGLKKLAQRPASARTWEEFFASWSAKPEGYLHGQASSFIRVAWGGDMKMCTCADPRPDQGRGAWALKRYEPPCLVGIRIPSRPSGANV